MKYVVTGSLGHISKPLVQHLVSAGHSVTVISSSADRTHDITALGATPAIGSVTDVAFLTATFAGADVVYTMVPPTWDAPDWNAPDWNAHIHNIGKNYAAAIKASGITKVVNLSSIGAHMPTGCGPVSGLYWVETELNALDAVDVVHLRPGFFYYNFLSQLGLIRHMGIMGGNYGQDTTLILVHTSDIADVAASFMLNPQFSGKSIQYISSDECTTTNIAATIGAAIGKPELPWVNFSNEESLNGMLQAGLLPEVASNYTEMGAAMASGQMSADYILHKPIKGKISFDEFAQEFAAIFAA
jgi:uncharacterized protein YbjT (DUF2867 family)